MPATKIPRLFESRTGWHSNPVHDRDTNPVLASSSAIFLARFEGIAPPKLPMPTSLIPIISPCWSRSGPHCSPER